MNPSPFAGSTRPLGEVSISPLGAEPGGRVERVSMEDTMMTKVEAGQVWEAAGLAVTITEVCDDGWARGLTAGGGTWHGTQRKLMNDLRLVTPAPYVPRFEVGQVWRREPSVAIPWHTEWTVRTVEDGGTTASMEVTACDLRTTVGLFTRSEWPLSSDIRLVTPAPYVPQVGDVVEWTREPERHHGLWTVTEVRGDKFDAINGARLAGGYDQSWVRLVSRPDAAVAEECPDPIPGTTARAGDTVSHANGRRAVVSAVCSDSCGLVVMLADGTGDTWPAGKCVVIARAVAEEPPPEPHLHNGTCHRGHAAYVGLFAARCETCDAIAAVMREEPALVERDAVCNGSGLIAEMHWHAGDADARTTDDWHTHPLRSGAIALWREARVKALHEDGLARAALLRGGR